MESIGCGGFGITYLAEQVMAERKVCIKEFFPEEYYNRDANGCSISLGSQGCAKIMETFKAKFIKEAKTIAKFDHSNIIHIHDVFEENGTAYYVMEYIDGESLSAVVKRRGALDEAAAVGYIRQVADALSYIHEQRIMHLDVKPGNVMLRSRDDRAILIDFGLSKHYNAESGEATWSSPVGVSHGFAPMEQYKSGGVKEFSPATDIYSLGATLYYLVTGLVPPEAADVSDEGLPALPAHLSQGVRTAIERSMADKRKARPQSIAEFLALLEDNTPEVLAIPTPKPTPSPVYTPVSAPMDNKISVAASAPVADERKVVGAPAPKAQPTPQQKNEPKPKRSKRGLWIMLAAFVVAAVASFVLLGGSSSDSKPVTKPESPTNEDSKPVTQPNNEIWYTSSYDKVVNPHIVGKDIFIFGAEIESNTYKNGKGIIKFKGDVTEIGDWAFYDCDNLTSVTIPDSVSKIGEKAFYDCGSLTSVTIPVGVMKIENSAFRDCDSLTSITIPNSVTTIGGSAFSHCESLTRVTISVGVTTIGDYAFHKCSNLTRVTIPNSVTTIGGSAFSYCESLTSVTIPNSVVYWIQEYTFAYCSNLTSVTIPDSVKCIGDYAFYDCGSLTSVTIPDSVRSIGYDAFWGCGRLSKETENKIKSISSQAF